MARKMLFSRNALKKRWTGPSCEEKVTAARPHVLSRDVMCPAPGKTGSSESLNKPFLINEFMTEMVHLSKTQLFPLMVSSAGFSIFLQH